MCTCVWLDNIGTEIHLKDSSLCFVYKFRPGEEKWATQNHRDIWYNICDSGIFSSFTLHWKQYYPLIKKKKKEERKVET